jgi:carbamoyl-phosphate synthase large subunit
MQLAKDGFLDENNVKLLGGQPPGPSIRPRTGSCSRTLWNPSGALHTLEGRHQYDDSLAFADEIVYPVIVRPAFTLGGTGGGIAADPTTFAR